MLDPGIRALGAHDHRYQKLPWCLMVQVAAVIRTVFFIEKGQNPIDPLIPLRFCLSLHLSSSYCLP